MVEKTGCEIGDVGRAFALVGRFNRDFVHEMADKIGISHSEAGKVVADKHGLRDSLPTPMLKKVILQTAEHTNNSTTIGQVRHLLLG